MGLLYGEDRKADALLCPDPHLTSMLFAAHGDIHWRDDSALYFFFGNQHRNWTYGITTQHYAHTQHYTPALSCGFTCMCLNTDSRLKGVKHDPFDVQVPWHAELAGPKAPPKAPPKARNSLQIWAKKCWPINVQSRSFYGLEFNGRWSHPEKDRNHRHGVTTFLHLPRWTVCGLLFLWSKRGLEQVSTEIVQDVRLATNHQSPLGVLTDLSVTCSALTKSGESDKMAHSVSESLGLQTHLQTLKGSQSMVWSLGAAGCG